MPESRIVASEEPEPVRAIVGLTRFDTNAAISRKRREEIVNFSTRFERARDKKSVIVSPLRAEEKRTRLEREREGEGRRARLPLSGCIV